MEEALFPHVHGNVILHNQEVELTSMSMDEYMGVRVKRQTKRQTERELCVVCETTRQTIPTDELGSVGG